MIKFFAESAKKIKVLSGACLFMLASSAYAGHSSPESLTSTDSMDKMGQISAKYRAKADSQARLMAEARSQASPIRIISLAPIVTENLFDLGLGINIVGVDNMSDGVRGTAKIPKVASIDSVNFEEIVALAPDLIVAWNDFYPTLEDDLEKFGIRSVVFRMKIERIADFQTAILELGRVTHSDDRAILIKDKFTSGLKSIKNRYLNYPTHSVFYMIWDDPIYTVSENTWINDMIEICGGLNPMKNFDIPYPLIDQELLIAAAPEIIIDASVRSEETKIPRILLDRVSRLKQVDNTHRISLRTLSATEEMCALIHAGDALYEPGEQADGNKEPAQAENSPTQTSDDDDEENQDRPPAP